MRQETDMESKPEDGVYVRVRNALFIYHAVHPLQCSLSLLPFSWLHWEFSASSLKCCGFFQGLFIEGAKWDREKMTLGESLPKILFDTLPIVSFKSSYILTS
jgi:hypothetical protein